MGRTRDRPAKGVLLKRCLDCGEDICRRHGNSVRCVGCAKKRGIFIKKEWSRSPKEKEAQAKYQRSPEGKARAIKYSKSPKGKRVAIKYNHSPKGKILRAKQRALRKRYGYNMLNVYFPGSVGHHVNDMDVVFIPEEIHSTAHRPNKERHRKEILEYYGNIENMIHQEGVGG